MLIVLEVLGLVWLVPDHKGILGVLIQSVEGTYAELGLPRSRRASVVDSSSGPAREFPACPSWWPALWISDVPGYGLNCEPPKDVGVLTPLTC